MNQNFTSEHYQIKTNTQTFFEAQNNVMGLLLQAKICKKECIKIAANYKTMETDNI